MAADEAGDAERAGELAAEMVAVVPNSYRAWFEAGMYSKARADWSESAARNARAVQLFDAGDDQAFEGENPAAWNLGIAATALADWPTARRAWTAYGVDGLGEGEGPIDVDLGTVPIRLNPDRPSLAHQVSPDLGDTAVVWCWRRSPAHAVIASVPLPESGHRFRDVLLHDGEPKGSRLLRGQEVPVFDELARLETSELSTWQARLLGDVGAEDLDVLADLLGSRGFGVDNWSGIRLFCAECSQGSPGAGHVHEPVDAVETVLGLAGDEDGLRAGITEWLADHQHVALVELTLLG